MDCKQILELLPAHMDRELSVRESIEIDMHLSGCAACQAEYAKQRAVRAAVSGHVTYFKAPGPLHDRIMAVLPSPSAGPRPQRVWNWSVAGTALVSVVAIAWSLGLYLTAPTPGDRLAEEVVSEHVRSLMLDHATDVPSSDRHTVKPWFTGKLDFSPPVYDLAAEGFPLVGGRLDYLDHRPVAALVYRSQRHVINLFVLPAAAGKDAAPRSSSRQGYHLIHWAHDGMAYWAVSDVEPVELGRFRDLLVAREESPRRPP